MPTVNDVADYILDRLASGRTIEAVKLHKLLYLCQNWSIAIFNTQLFEDDYEDWSQSPVYPQIYPYHTHHITVSAHSPIGGSATRLTDEEKQLVDAVIADYGNMDTFRLVDLTHLPDTA